MIDEIKNHITEIKDFPKPNILFRDITPLLQSQYFIEAIKLMGEKVKKPMYWVGIESRGFIFASALSTMFGGGVILCRKKGKLPPPVVSVDYSLEYGTDTLEVNPGEGDVVIVDDVLATGGTLTAAEELLKNAGYNVTDSLVLINLSGLNIKYGVKHLLKYE